MSDTNLNARLDRAVRAAVPGIVGVSIGDEGNKATWTVQPSSLQSAAQATIDAFDVNAVAVVNAELDIAVKAAIDNERLYSAIVWTILDTYSAPATKAKYDTARQKIIDV